MWRNALLMTNMTQVATLAQTLKAGKLGGADAAEALANVVGPSADLALVVESLQAATAVLRAQAKATHPGGSGRKGRWSQRANASARHSTRLPLARTDFEVSGFWESHALAVARAAARLQSAHDSQTSPVRVFVYDLLPPFSDWSPANATLSAAFGEPLGWGGRLRDSNQYGFAQMLHYRLHHSKIYRTVDPQQAELFFVPLLTKAKKEREITRACGGFHGSEVEAHLPHLNLQTAHRHILALSKEHVGAQLSNCSWFINPPPLLARAIRLAYSHPQPESIAKVSLSHGYNHVGGNHAVLKKVGYTGSFLHSSDHAYPNLFSVPFVSSVHWTSCNVATCGTRLGMHDGALQSANGLPWQAGRPRPILMLFIGGTDHGDRAARSLIEAQCRAYHDPAICTHTRFNPKRTMQSLLLKQRAKFCLEPAGDSPFRKSIADDVVLGCVPVFFHPMQNNSFPWLWGAWEALGRVAVPRDLFLQRAIDLKQLLSTVPPLLLQQMQAALASHAIRFQLSLNDDPGDQLDMVLRGARDHSLRHVGGQRSNHPPSRTHRRLTHKCSALL